MSHAILESVLSPKRFITKENAQIEVYGQMGKIFCRLANLSQTGAFLEIINAKLMPKAGDLVRITVLLRQVNKTHVLDAEVVWCKGLGLGLQFIKKEQLYEKLATLSVGNSVVKSTASHKPTTTRQ